MSLGSRLYHRSRSSIVDSLLAAPRDSLLFLCPRFYASTAIEASEETVQSDNASETTSVSIRYYFNVRRREKERCHEPPKQMASKEGHESGAIVPMKAVPSERPRPVDQTPSEQIARDELYPMTVDYPRNTLRIKDAPNVRRVLAVAEGRQKHKALNAFVNSRLKDQGLWSYDWRVPLDLLQQHHQPDSTEPEKEKKQILRGVLSKQRRTEDRSRFCEIRADRIPRPAVWSPLTFFRYVEDLTSSSVSRIMHHRLYGPYESHVAVIARTLEERFSDASLKDSLTVRAFRTACVFLIKHGLISTIRALFTRMDTLGLSFNVGTFNAILYGAASRKDLHNYTSFLQAMVRRGVKPNGETWIALLMALHTKAVKLLIMRTMRERGVLDQTSILKDAVNQIVADEVATHFDSGQDVTAFLDLMDREYGPDWLSVSAGNRILDRLGERGLLLQSVDVLNFMKERRIMPNAVTLSTLLGHCARQRNMDGAIQVLRVFESSFGIVPVGNHFHQLFMLTWKNQLLNCCRVVWRYACMAAAVSYPMQKLLTNSLACPFSPEQKSMAEAWRCIAGKCIVGLRSNSAQQLSAMAQTAAQPDEKLEVVRFIKHLLSEHCEAATRYRPKSGLAAILEEALVMDRRWVQEGRWKDSSTMWQVESCIDVPVVGGSEGKHFPSLGN